MYIDMFAYAYNIRNEMRDLYTKNTKPKKKNNSPKASL